MTRVEIHRSGAGADCLAIESHGNGLAYSVQFGESGHPMRTLYFQGDDATELRAQYDRAETLEPENYCRKLWLSILENYL